MDTKLLARAGAAVFVGCAIAMTLVQLRDKPRQMGEGVTDIQLRDDNPLQEQLRACAKMGEEALSAPQCRAASAENRRRFLGVDYPEAYGALTDPGLPAARDNLIPAAPPKQQGDQ
jgi:conjugative transfer region protein TrbK